MSRLSVLSVLVLKLILSTTSFSSHEEFSSDEEGGPSLILTPSPAWEFTEENMLSVMDSVEELLETPIDVNEELKILQPKLDYLLYISQESEVTAGLSTEQRERASNLHGLLMERQNKVLEECSLRLKQLNQNMLKVFMTEYKPNAQILNRNCLSLMAQYDLDLGEDVIDKFCSQIRDPEFIRTLNLKDLDYIFPILQKYNIRGASLRPIVDALKLHVLHMADLDHDQ